MLKKWDIQVQHIKLDTRQQHLKHAIIMKIIYILETKLTCPSVTKIMFTVMHLQWMGVYSYSQKRDLSHRLPL